MTILDSDRQAALREVLKAGYWINAFEAAMLGRAFGVPGSVILQDVKLLRAQMPRNGQARGVA
jgi:hypothetical protein